MQVRTVTNAGENVTNKYTTGEKTTAKTHPTKTQRAKKLQCTKRWKRNDCDDIDESTNFHTSNMKNHFQLFETQSCGTKQNYQQLQVRLKTHCPDVASGGREIRGRLIAGSRPKPTLGSHQSRRPKPLMGSNVVHGCTWIIIQKLGL